MTKTPRLDRARCTCHSPNRIPVALSAFLLALAAVATRAAFAAPAPAVKGSPEQQFQMALEAQSAREYRTMMKLLRQAAEAGNLEAQEMLGIALLSGPTLYGNAVKSDRCEAGNWMRRAAAQGSDVGKHQLTFPNRLRQAPTGKDVC